MTDSAGEVVQASPDWLPRGWIEQLKVLRSGREIRCYINMTTMQKFFSKEDVLEYITNGSTCPASSQRNNEFINVLDRNDSTPITNERPDWLPKGWNMELKFRSSGRSSGQKYSVYVDPLTGRKFYSKPEVFRYLNAIKGDNCTTQQETDGVMQHLCNHDISTQTGREFQSKPETPQDLEVYKSNSHFGDKRTKGDTQIFASNVGTDAQVDEDLPPGWIKEVRTRKSGKSARSDPFYIDPLSGYEFRSKKDVFRYLESGDLSSCAIKPRKRCSADLVSSNDKPSISAADKKEQSIEPATRRHLFADNKISDISTPVLLRAGAKTRRQSERLSSQSRLSLATKSEGVQKESPQDIIAVNCTKPQEDQDNLVLPATETSKGKQDYKKVGGKKSVSTPGTDVGPEKASAGIGMGKGGDKTRTNVKLKRKERRSLPCRSSKRLAGLEPELPADASYGNTAREIATGDPSKPQTSEIQSLVLDTPEVSVSNQLCLRPETKPTCSSDANAQLNGQLNFRDEMSHDEQATCQEQSWKLEVSHEDDGKQNLQVASQTTDSGSGPYQNVIFKTSGDEIQEKETPQLSSLANVPNISQKNSAQKKMVKSREQKQSTNSRIAKKKGPKQSSNSSPAKTKEPNLQSGSAKRVSRAKAGEFNIHFGDMAAQGASKNSTMSHANLGVASQFYMTNGVSWNFKALPESGTANKTSEVNVSSVDISGPSLAGPFYRNAEPLQSHAVASLQLQNPQSMELHHDKPESRNFLPLGTSWSDPCMEFAIKTLTGAIPVPDTTDLDLVSPSATSDLNEIPDESRYNNSRESRYYMNTCSSKDKIVLPFQVPGHRANVVDLEKANSISNRRDSQVANSKIEVIPDMNLGQGGVLVDIEKANSISNRRDSQVANSRIEVIPDMNLGRGGVPVDIEKANSISTEKACYIVNSGNEAIPDMNLSQGGVPFDIEKANSISTERACHIANRSEAIPDMNLGQGGVPFDIEKANSISTEKACHIANRSEAIPDMNLGQGGVLGGTSLHLQPGPSIKFSLQGSGCRDVQFFEEPSNSNDKPLGRYDILGGQQQKENEKMNPEVERLDSEIFLPFSDPWYDPCLDFAFKTLTGTIPLDDNLAAQNYFNQQLLNTAQPQRDNGSFPDFGLSSISQSNESVRSDTADLNVPSQQFPVEPTFKGKAFFP